MWGMYNAWAVSGSVRIIFILLKRWIAGCATSPTRESSAGTSPISNNAGPKPPPSPTNPPKIRNDPAPYPPHPKQKTPKKPHRSTRGIFWDICWVWWERRDRRWCRTWLLRWERFLWIGSSTSTPLFNWENKHSIWHWPTSTSTALSQKSRDRTTSWSELPVFGSLANTKKYTRLAWVPSLRSQIAPIPQQSSRPWRARFSLHYRLILTELLPYRYSKPWQIAGQKILTGNCLAMP